MLSNNQRHLNKRHHAARDLFIKKRTRDLITLTLLISDQ